jgi:hypothetical protein
MTHSDAGSYAAKHGRAEARTRKPPPRSEEDCGWRRLRRCGADQRRTRYGDGGGRPDCRLLEIRIGSCQLGLFGHDAPAVG